ncbi:hypothetical protein AAHC03_013584 [Spirometra sp. Aus1]
MLATLSPSSLHYEDTLSTLQYAKRAHSIVNTAVINEDPEGKIIRELMSEIDRLRQQAKLAKTPNSPLASQIKNLKALLRARECEVAFLSNELTRRTIESAKLRSENQRVVEQLVGSKFGVPPPPLPFQSSGIPVDAIKTPLKALNASPPQLSRSEMLPPPLNSASADEEKSPTTSTFLRDRWAPDGQDATWGSVGDDRGTAPAIDDNSFVKTLVDDAYPDPKITSGLHPTHHRVLRMEAKPIGAASANQETQTEGQTPLTRSSVPGISTFSKLESVAPNQLTEQGTNTSLECADSESAVAAIDDFDHELRVLGSRMAKFEVVDAATCTTDDGMAAVLIEATELLTMKDKLNTLATELASAQNELAKKSAEVINLREETQALSDANRSLKKVLLETNEAISNQKKTLTNRSTSTLPSEIGFDVIAVDRLAQLQSELQDLRVRLFVDRQDTATCTADDYGVCVKEVGLQATCTDPGRLSSDLAASVNPHLLDVEEDDPKGQHGTLSADVAKAGQAYSLSLDVTAAAADATIGARIDTVSLQKLTDVQGVLSTLRSRLEAEEAVRRADRVTCTEGVALGEESNTKLKAKLATLTSHLAASVRSRAQLRTELSNLRFNIEELEGEKEILQFEVDSSRRLLDLTQKENAKLKSKYTKAVDLLMKYLRESGQPWPSQLYCSDM